MFEKSISFYRIAKLFFLLVGTLVVFGCGGGGGGGVTSPPAPSLSEAGGLLIFLANNVETEITDLYKATVDADSVAVRLSDNTVLEIADAAISPDGNFAAYKGRPDPLSPWQLYVVDIHNGGDSALVSIAGGEVVSYVWSGDSERLAYCVKVEGDPRSLYVVNRGDEKGGTRVSTHFVSDTCAWWGPNSEYVVYKSRSEALDPWVLYLAIGPDFDVVEDISSDDLSVDQVSWSPDSAEPKLAYTAGEQPGGFDRLYSFAVESFFTHEVSGDISEGFEEIAGSVADFKWSSDGNTLAFRADFGQEGAYELFIADFEGQDGFKVNPDFLPVEEENPVVEAMTIAATADAGAMVFSSVKRYNWAPNGTDIAYLVDQEEDGVDELYVFKSPADEPAKVSGGPVLTQKGEISDVRGFAWMPDGDALVYRAIHEAVGGAATTKLYRVDAGGAETSHLSDGLDQAPPDFEGIGNVWDFMVSADGAFVAYLAEREGVFRLYATESGGSDHMLVSEDLAQNDGDDGGDIVGDVIDFRWLPEPNAHQLVYLADDEVDTMYKVHGIDLGEDNNESFDLSGSLTGDDRALCVAVTGADGRACQVGEL
ncbi:hypothetical protein FKG94_24350 [Exilibacterium tricleocarpae]|uniref:S9 family peptidase n=1 Tax=Exilibacterium tricleocarpae TaxID=2591008 RepID=A0A545SSV8_9GAMM|nr:hypothetical protein [Exilibacterium tricleocarpae]TQV68060.1 hypothetical protein FKG94_24350 [Exilibacterium tricleocarpae]